ncbi:hypothetical protein Scep_013740 [Stephania cephalantha]|uniref:O-fucosyltransferase family protein n=1 Tax=Stephania cephalantha TaxID=152367 RepID=A0AAP0IZY3_9MAGN
MWVGMEEGKSSNSSSSSSSGRKKKMKRGSRIISYGGGCESMRRCIIVSICSIVAMIWALSLWYPLVTVVLDRGGFPLHHDQLPGPCDDDSIAVVVKPDPPPLPPPMVLMLWAVWCTLGYSTTLLHNGPNPNAAAATVLVVVEPDPPLRARRKYKSNGFLRVSCNGGLNQMRSGICDMILPLFRKHQVIFFTKTDTRIANNGIPVELQKMRCRVNYQALKFAPRIKDTGDKLISILKRSGSFIVLHLRYEMDMLSFSGCSRGCSAAEAAELTRKRYATSWWKEKEIDPEKKRQEGLCPFTPEETALILKGLGIDNNAWIYIAAGEIYGGERRLAALRSEFPKLATKEMLLSEEDLQPFRNHSTQMAALDYMVSLAGDVFIPTYYGNMAKLVEGHRRYLGFKTTYQLNRKGLVDILDKFQSKNISWDEFSVQVKDMHEDRKGQAGRRTVLPLLPKEEDYFYANPQECLPD